MKKVYIIEDVDCQDFPYLNFPENHPHPVESIFEAETFSSYEDAMRTIKNLLKHYDVRLRVVQVEYTNPVMTYYNVVTK